MADETEDGTKTEDPSQKRIDDALSRGDVVKSHEVNTWFIIAGGTMVLFAFAHSMSADLNSALRGIIANSHRLPTDGRDLIAFAALLGTRVFGILAAPFLVLVGRVAAPRALEDLADVGGQADVLQTGPRQFRRRACQAHLDRSGDGRDFVAGALPPGGPRHR